ncbi:fimbrial protein [Ralstonia insidiosa]|uniref:fimbrial protein n=1 Tax=Ralstonia insidiosa TaxID=190721 RepID=UPI000CEE63F6|nr:fimbrial protein [Ralstonia insidiosa]
MKHALLAITAVVLPALVPVAHASEGTVDFQGKLVAQTCTVRTVGTAGNTVMLPTLSTSLLQTAGQTAGRTRFNISLTNCAGAAKSAAAFFEDRYWTDKTTGNLTYGTSGPLANLQVQLIDTVTDKPIHIGDPDQYTSTTQIPIDASGNATLPYAAQYYAIGPTSPGKRTTLSVWYSINYQ